MKGTRTGIGGKRQKEKENEKEPEEEEGEKDGGKTQEIAHPPQVLGPDVWDSLITYKLELPCLTDCLIDTVFFAPHLLL